MLLTFIGLMRLARTVGSHPRPALSLAGTAITVAGITAPSGAVLISGLLVLLVAMFLPSDAAQPKAAPCSARGWVPTTWHLPPPG
jgi:hypothetical protein